MAPGLGVGVIAVLVAAAGAVSVSAQAANLTQEIVESQRRLEQIRVERERLEREMRDARNQIQDVAAYVSSAAGS